MNDCQELLKIVGILKDEYTDFLVDICNIESPTDFKEGVDRVGRYVADRAEKHGWLVERCSQDVSGDVLCITMNPDSPNPPVCFSAHMDTVHPVGSFGDKPVRIVDDKIYGPGVYDCKGGIAAAFMAMDALERWGFGDRPVKLILQSDEETGSRGSKKGTVQYMYEKAKGSVAFLNCETGHKEGHVVTTKGICRFHFDIKGRETHSASCYLGSSAIAEAARKITELEKYKDKDSVTCNCGIIRGGSAENTVAANCFFSADFRFNTREDRELAAEIAHRVANTTYVEGTECKLTLVSSRPAMVNTPENAELFCRAQEIFLEYNMGDIQMLNALGGTDAADLTNMGITCMESFGIYGDGAHKLTEFAYVDSLITAASKLALVASCI